MTPWYIMKQMTSAVANFFALATVMRLIKCSADVMKNSNFDYIDATREKLFA